MLILDSGVYTCINGNGGNALESAQPKVVRSDWLVGYRVRRGSRLYDGSPTIRTLQCNNTGTVRVHFLRSVGIDSVAIDIYCQRWCQECRTEVILAG